MITLGSSCKTGSRRISYRFSYQLLLNDEASDLLIDPLQGGLTFSEPRSNPDLKQAKRAPDS